MKEVDGNRAGDKGMHNTNWEGQTLRFSFTQAGGKIRHALIADMSGVEGARCQE